MKGSRTRYSSSGLLKNAHTWRFAPSVALANRIGFSFSFGPADAKLEDSLVLTLSVVEVTRFSFVFDPHVSLRACLINSVLFDQLISGKSAGRTSTRNPRLFLTAFVIAASKDLKLPNEQQSSEQIRKED